ncbi:MAG: hypothetical protein AAF720_12980 [Pseudomonadota bacterium]
MTVPAFLSGVLSTAGSFFTKLGSEGPQMWTGTLIIGGGALAMAGIIGTGLDHRLPSEAERFPRRTDDKTEICFTSSIKLVKGADRGCYTRSTLAGMESASVIDTRGNEIVLTLTDPKDDLAPVAVIRNCKVFNEYKAKGWYAFSSREMRREVFYTRSCRTLDMMIRSQSPSQTQFDQGQLTEADIEPLLEQEPIGFVEGNADKSLSITGDARITQGAPGADRDGAKAKVASGPGVWTISQDGQRAVLQEIAHADFNADGYGDILVLIAIGADEATAITGLLALVEKKASNETPVISLVPPTYP